MPCLQSLEGVFEQGTNGSVPLKNIALRAHNSSSSPMFRPKKKLADITNLKTR
jgi:hypothetical protein